MKRTITALLLLLLVLSIPISAGAEAPADYIFDEAQLLTEAERAELNALARQISEQYGCGVYMMTAEDYWAYGYSFDIYDTAWNIYHDMELGYGPDRDGMLLLLSMADRDYATFFYGYAEYAFDSYGQEKLEEYFLDDFGDDDWYGGFRDYLETSDEFLAKALAGDPVRESPLPLVLVFILVACLIAFIVTAVFWAMMRNVRRQSSAGHYITADGLNLTARQDTFTHQTRTRRRLPSASGSSRSHARIGGGGSGRSGKF